MLADHLSSNKLSQRDKIFSILLLGGKSRYAVKDIISIGYHAGLRKIKKWNVSSILASDSTLAVKYPDGWALTTKGVKELAKKGIHSSASPVKAVASDLHSYLPQITNVRIKSFVEEAIGCLENNYFRAAVVLSWVGAISILQDEVLKNCLVKFNAEAKRQNSKWKDASTADHLSLLDESEFLELLASPNVAVIGKNVKEDLKLSGLKLRNGCGHPNTMQIGQNKAAGHVEFLIQNVYSEFLK